ncbi:MAG: glycosyltransferase [Candidatus Bathyarchaeia archaeon]|jgi:hypothetical protein
MAESRQKVPGTFRRIIQTIRYEEGEDTIHLPPLKIDYLKALTDDTGVFQHAKYCIPKRSEGYTTDDNARALIAAVKYQRLSRDQNIKRLVQIYLSFLNHMQKPDGNFHNYLSYERTFLDVDGSEDAAGRALWACGCAMNSSLPRDMRLVAKDIFDRGLPCVWRTVHLRFYASTILGLKEYYAILPDVAIKEAAEKLADNLTKHLQDESKDEWHWFEPHLTYDNARMPQALFAAYSMTKESKYLAAAEESMDFLLKTQMIDNVYVPIGNDGWYKRGGNRAIYDQQPLEPSAMVDAAIEAYYATDNKHYLEVANTAFEWFMGKNSRGIMVYNPETAGCYDGLAPEKVNYNQGAESSICYLLARLKLEEVKHGHQKRI